MRHTVFSSIATASLMAFSAPSAIAGGVLGAPLGTALSATLGVALPTGASGLLGLAAAGVVAGVWLVKRKK